MAHTRVPSTSRLAGQMRPVLVTQRPAPPLFGLKQVTITTDGSCTGSKGPVGAWAFIARYGTYFIERTGRVQEDTTAQRMEITAAIEGLKALKHPCEVTIITDSQYLFSGIQTWRHKWRRNGWAYRTNGEPIANVDLWRLLDAELEKHVAHCEWIRSHNGDHDNERCDYLAKMSLRGAGPALPKLSSA
jgi:ribonuclease HI